MVGFDASKIIQVLILPPFGPMILGALGTALIPVRRGAGRGLMIACLVLLYVGSVPAVAELLARPLYAVAPLSDLTKIGDARAIVILGAGLYVGGPEYGGDTISGEALERVRYGAYLYRLTRKPILVTGGNPQRTEISEGEAMRRVLEDEFGVPVRWIEDRSLNTRGNARFSWDILSAEGSEKIVLVTHAYHMGRATSDFERAGFDVVQAPTKLLQSTELSVFDFLPSASAMSGSAVSLREWLGRAWGAIHGWADIGSDRPEAARSDDRGK